MPMRNYGRGLRVQGHALLAYGAPRFYRDPETNEFRDHLKHPNQLMDLRPACECGEFAPSWASSEGKVRAWHRQHKIPYRVFEIEKPAKPVTVKAAKPVTVKETPDFDELLEL